MPWHDHLPKKMKSQAIYIDLATNDVGITINGRIIGFIQAVQLREHEKVELPCTITLDIPGEIKQASPQRYGLAPPSRQFAFIKETAL